MFSFFKKKPATPEPAADTPVAEAAPATAAEAQVQAPAAAPQAPAAAQPAPSSGGWLNRLRRSFGSEEGAADSAQAPAASADLRLAELILGGRAR